MKKYILEAGCASLDGLKLEECDVPKPGPGEVLVRVRACSLNYRDRLMTQGMYFGGPIPEAITPLSDGAGEVDAVGEGVTRFKPGDRVAGIFFQDWIDGPPNPAPGAALGGPGAKGMLAEYVTLPERGLVHMAPHLSFEEAATLPCAGVTAWNALMYGRKPLRPGDCVLVLGTGGVSMLALQIAHAAGAHVIATSSSDEKLARAKKLGAAETINYRETENWGPKAVELSGRTGADCVIEVGGAGTLAQSMQAVAYNGEIALIGVLTREGDTHPHPLMLKGASIRGIFVGSRRMAEELNHALAASNVKPAIDRVFPFEDARGAYQYQAGGAFSKVVIAV